MSQLKVEINTLQTALERDSAALNLAMVKENDAISHRKACQVAYENSARAFELGYQEIMAANAVVRKVD